MHVSGRTSNRPILLTVAKDKGRYLVRYVSAFFPNLKGLNGLGVIHDRDKSEDVDVLSLLDSSHTLPT